ncbi:hypothetical protein POTOM_036249 [Populus tomentosa]|uniref:Pentatricopeptide repeat-containing protein n=1 Tax=Populus tomentosa TaxID=118781 RepID=A0A8X7ZAB1_POPTO|nr:hypothetical protein POTOM_036249 [Populus tomentosa]
MPREAGALSRKLGEGGYLPDISTFNIPVTCLLKGLDVNETCGILDSFIEQGRGMEGDPQCDERGSKGFQSDAEVFLPTLLLLQMLLERGLKLTFSLIIDGLCQAQQVDDALVCFSEMVEWGISLNAVTHNLLIRYLCVRGDAARSMKPLLDMQKHGKSLDILSAFLVGVSIFCCNLGKADEDGSQTGTGIAGGMPQTGTGIVDGDPAEVVAKALLCNFDVSEHLQAEQNNAYNTANQILLGLGFMFAEPALLLLYYDVCNLWLEVSCFQRDISQLRCSEGGDERYFSLA